MKNIIAVSEVIWSLRNDELRSSRQPCVYPTFDPRTFRVRRYRDASNIRHSVTFSDTTFRPSPICLPTSLAILSYIWPREFSSTNS